MLLLTDPILITIINLALILVTSLSLFIYRYVFPKKTISFPVLLIIISLLPILSLFRQGTFEAGDLRVHTAQLISFYHNLQDGILLPYWAGELCGGYGCPVFMMEYLSPYYIGSFFHFLGFSFLNSIKLLLAFSFITSGLTMYWWAKDEFGKKAAFVASLTYLFAPFHLADIHFRGSIGEVLAFTFMPLLFLSTKKLVLENEKKYFLLTSLLICLLLLTHSSTTAIITPIAFIYGILLWRQKKKRTKKELFILFSSFAHSVLLSLFYWLPLQQEIQYTWHNLADSSVQFMNAIDYLISPVGFGFLFQGHKAEVRPIIGYIQIGMVLFSLFLLQRKTVSKQFRNQLIFLLMSFFALFFMMLPISSPIWEHITVLHSFIMVWRILVPLAFVTAAITGIAVKSIKNNRILFLLSFIIIVSTSLNWANRKMVPELANPMYGENELYTEYFIKDNPVYKKRIAIRGNMREQIVVKERYSSPIEFLSGKGEFIETKRTQQLHEYVVSVTENAVIKENTLYFPGWKILVDNKPVYIHYENNTQNSFGKITFSLKKGIYLVDAIFTDTPVRSISKKISFCTFLIGIVYIFSDYILLFFKKVTNTRSRSKVKGKSKK